MKFNYAVLGLVLGYSSFSFAMFCPNNFNQINIGDPIDQVQTQCGQPTAQKVFKSNANVPQEWTYYVQMDPTLPGTMKVTFAFVDNKVTNLSSNGIGVGATTICNGANIQLGTSTEDVKKACGAPAMIVQTNLSPESAQGTPAEVITEWRYDNANPPATLIFENGILTQRK